VFGALPGLLALPSLATEPLATLHSKVYQFDQLPVHEGKNMLLRQILHESDLGPFGVPHPPHHHKHEELIMRMDGHSISFSTEL
jgi:hypothetical protein